MFQVSIVLISYAIHQIGNATQMYDVRFVIIASGCTYVGIKQTF